MLSALLAFATFTAGSASYCQSGYASTPAVSCALANGAVYPYVSTAAEIGAQQPTGAGLMYKCPVSIALGGAAGAGGLAAGLIKAGVRAFPTAELDAANYPVLVYGTHCRVCQPGTAPVLDEAESQFASLRGAGVALTDAKPPSLDGVIYQFRPVGVTCRRVKMSIEGCDYYGADGACAACVFGSILTMNNKCVAGVAAVGHCLRHASAATPDVTPAAHACELCEYRHYLSAGACKPIPNCDATKLPVGYEKEDRETCAECSEGHFYFKDPEDASDDAKSKQCRTSCPERYVFVCMTCKRAISNCKLHDLNSCGALQCAECDRGYYYAIASQTCESCPQGCAACESTAHCTECLETFGFTASDADGKHICLPCVENCLACPDNDQLTCKNNRCAAGYYSYPKGDKYGCDKAAKDCSALDAAAAADCHCGQRIQNCDICGAVNINQTENLKVVAVNQVHCARCKTGFNATKTGAACYACAAEYCLQCQQPGDDNASVGLDTSKSCLKGAYTEALIKEWQLAQERPVNRRAVPAYFHSCAPGYAWLPATAADADLTVSGASGASGDFSLVAGADQPWNCRKIDKPAHCTELDANDRCIVCEHGFFVKPDGTCAWLHKCPNVVVKAGVVKCDYANPRAGAQAENCPKNALGKDLRMKNDFCKSFQSCQTYDEEGDMLCLDGSYYADAGDKFFIRSGVVSACYEGCAKCAAVFADGGLLGMFSKCTACDQHGEALEVGQFAYYVNLEGFCVPASVDHESCTRVGAQAGSVACVACEAAFYLDTADSTCKPCPEHCLKCAAAENLANVACETAEDGWYVESGAVADCEERFDRCLRCSAAQCFETPHMVSCEYVQGQTPAYGLCAPYGDEFCVKPTEESENQPAEPIPNVIYNQKCAKCAPGHYLEASRCPFCVARYGAQCAECDEFRCTRCLNGLTMAPLAGLLTVPSGLTQCVACQDRFGADCMACDDLQCVKCGAARIYDRTAQNCVLATAAVSCDAGCLRCEVESFASGETDIPHCLMCVQGLQVGDKRVALNKCGYKPWLSDLPTACAEVDYAGNCLRCMDRNSYVVKGVENGALTVCAPCPSAFGCFVDSSGSMWQYDRDGKAAEVPKTP